MKTKKLMIAMAAGALATANAHAADINPYLAGKVGLMTASWDGATTTPTGGMFSGAVGARFKTDFANLRAEFEYSGYNMTSQESEEIAAYTYRDTDITVKATTYLGNFYIDFLEDYRLKPYLGLSLGYGSMDEEIKITTAMVPGTPITGSGNGFAYGFQAGFGFRLFSSLSMDLGLRYTNLALDPKSMTLFGGSAGLRWTF